MFQVCSPEDMVGFTEAAKCAMIRKIFDDAYRFNLKSLLFFNYLIFIHISGLNVPVCWWTILRDYWTTVPLARDTPTPHSRRSLSSSKRCELIGNWPQSTCFQVPPKGRRLLILATSSQREILDQVLSFKENQWPWCFYTQMEMIPCFTDVLHVPNLSTAEHLMAVIRKSGVSNTVSLHKTYSPTTLLRLSVKMVSRNSHGESQEGELILGWDCTS